MKCIFLILIFSCFKKNVYAAEVTAKELAQYLLSSYEPRVIPNTSGSLVIENEMNILFFLGVDEQDETIKMLLWSAQRWNDSGLIWNDTEFANITNINIPATSIWLPDWHVYNLVDSKDSIDLSRLFARVKSDGNVQVDFYKMLDTRCQLNVLNFPFDEQSCPLIFGTWAYTEKDLKFLPTSVDFENMNINGKNSEWDIVNFTFEEVVNTYNDQRFQEIHYLLLLKRKPLFYVVSLIFPTFLVVTVSVIGLFVPTTAGGERTEKVTFGLTTLLTLSIMLQLLAGEMPRSADGLPVIGRFLICECVICVLALAVSVTLLCCAENYGDKQPSNAIIWFVQKSTKISDKSWMKRRTPPNADQLKNPDLAPILKYLYEKEETEKIKEIWTKFFLKLDLYLCLLFLAFHLIFTMIIFYPFRAAIFYSFF